MKLLLHSSLLVIVFFLLLSIVPSQSEQAVYSSCNSNNKTDGNTQFSKTINESISKLVSSTIHNGFSTSSIIVLPKNKTRINGMAQCRGDLPEDVCTTCIRNASKVIRDSNTCPNQSDAVIMYDDCMLRYSTKDFFGEVDDSVGLILYNTGKVKQYKVFNITLEALMDDIIKQAVESWQKPGRLQGLGKGSRKLPNSRKLYAVVQCTRDLTDLKCSQCLVMARSNLYEDKTCRNKEGCRVLYSSCYLRYELYPCFYPVEKNGSMALPSFGNYESVVVGTTTVNS